MKHPYIVFAFISLFLLLFTSCSAKLETVQERDVVIENIKKSTIHTEDDYISKIVYDYSDSKSVLKDMGFSSDTIALYDKDYYESNALIVIIIATGVSYEFSLGSIKSDNNGLNIQLNKKIPPYVDDLLINKGILIEVSKNDIYKSEDVKVSINTIKE